MKNVTLSLDETTLSDAKGYAASRGISLNAFVKGLIEKEIRRPGSAWFDAAIARAKQLDAQSSDGQPLSREEIYNR